jgi:uncharacterized protein (DUF2267 family)
MKMRGSKMDVASNLDLNPHLKVTEGYLDDLMRNLAWHDRRRGWSALLAVLHALRDCLGRDEAVCLGAQLPPLLRGFYYEGWHPHTHRPTSRDAFLERIRDGLKHDIAIDAEQVARAVLALLARRIPAAELEDTKAATPSAVHGLWPA